MTTAEGTAAAKLCALNLLAHLRIALGGSLDNVAGCVSLRGYVNATPTYPDHAAVVDGASEVLTAVFGEAGRHARAAIGMGSLPKGFAVEVEAVFDLHQPVRMTKAPA